MKITFTERTVKRLEKTVNTAFSHSIPNCYAAYSKQPGRLGLIAIRRPRRWSVSATNSLPEPLSP